MYQFHVAICDDSEMDINIISEYISQIKEYDIKITTFASGEELTNYCELSNSKLDIIFLDMEMSGIDGIDTANQIRKKDRNVVIIFVTNHRKYMERSFECRPFRFLVKPLDSNVFREVFLKACEAIDLEHPYLVFQHERKLVRLPYDDIAYFENKSHWVYIFATNGVYKTYTTFSKLMKKLDINRFILTHKSYIINLDYFRELKGFNIKLMNGALIPISRNYKNDVKFKILSYHERKYLI